MGEAVFPYYSEMTVLQFAMPDVARSARAEGTGRARRPTSAHALAQRSRIVLACAEGGGLRWLFWPLLIFVAAADLCGTAALIVGGIKGTLPAALAVGYSVTALAAACGGGG